MSATNAFETALLQHLFNNSALANVGDASGLQPAATAGSFQVSLHTASLNDTTATSQSASEAAYTGYGRVAVARSAGGWTVSSDTASNTAAITYGACTAGSETEQSFGIGSASTGAGNLFIYGALTASLAVSNGITPQFAAGALDVTLD